MPQPFLATILLGIIAQATPVAAHEFWIQPESAATASVRVGQMLVGENLPYLDKVFRSALHFGAHGETVLRGRQGDIPALSVDLSVPGLHILTVETEPAYVVFDDLPEFSDYLAYEGLQSVLSQHVARGLPTKEIAEEYLRYAKSFVRVGSASADTDVPVGLRYELIALTSPFAAQDGKVDLQILWEGVAQSGTQIAVFHKGSEYASDVTRQVLVSDKHGKVAASVGDAGLYVFNAVHMLPAEGPGSVVWQSHWASLSFTVGGPELDQ